ncbi:MAG: hypothetical protein R3315_05965, partial [Woeseiaceae bacterium]|nr:hypothetical protein [Woeseiaceae bacterium]
MCSCSRGIILVALVAGLLAGCGADEAGPEFDVILEGGTVYDGSPGEGFAADVGIARDRITAVGSLAGRDAALRLDVSGLAVMPGIIDIHNHAIRP